MRRALTALAIIAALGLAVVGLVENIPDPPHAGGLADRVLRMKQKPGIAPLPSEGPPDQGHMPAKAGPVTGEPVHPT